MKLKDFAKSKKELEREITKNNEPFLMYDERNRMAKTNQTEYKLYTTLFFSLLSYLVIFIGSAISLAVFKEPLFASIPKLVYPAIILGGSVGLGTIARVWVEKKFQLKERLRAFSNAKTDAEKLVEEIKNEIELKKIETRNLALNRTIERITSDEKIYVDVSGKYTLSDKEEKTQEQTKEKVSSLMAILKDKYALLDSLVARKTIANKFWSQRQKGQNIMSNLITAAGCGLGTMMYFTITLMTASVNSSTIVTQGISGIITIFSPTILAGIAGGIYSNIRNNNYQKAFTILNETLQENSLPSKSNDTFEERQTLKNMVDNTISEIVKITIELQENKRALEEFNLDCTDEDPAPALTFNEELQKDKSKTDDSETPSLEDQTFEMIPPASEPPTELKTLAKRRKGPYQK